MSEAGEPGQVGPEVDGRRGLLPAPGLVLEGRHVRLVPVDPAAHAGPLFRASHGDGHEALWRYLAVGPFTDEAAFRTYLETAAAASDPFMLVILDLGGGGAPVGHATFMRMEPAHRVYEVGNILYTPALQRSPGATEAMYLMARHAFEALGARRYEWKCNALNLPSRRAAERYGFRPEGLFRQHMIAKGRNRDTAWYSMLDGEWPALRTAFARWLDAANFDGAGRQRLPLSGLTARVIPGHGLRRAGPDDMPAFEALQFAAYAWNRQVLGVTPMPLRTPTAEVFGRYELWLEEDADGLAGAIALDPRPTDLELWSVSVRPDRQNSGLGRALLAATEARSRALGLPAVRLFTGAPLTKNIDWYTRRGYATERTEELADRRLVHMVKHLDG